MNPARVLGPAIISGYFQRAENSFLTHVVSIITTFMCLLFRFTTDQAYVASRVYWTGWS